MNLLLTPQTDWDSNDAAALKEFLGSDLAKKAFAFVSDACPALLDGADVNRTLVRSGEVKGFTLAIESLFSLVALKPEPPTQSETYPSLDDESAWENKSTTKL